MPRNVYYQSYWAFVSYARPDERWARWIAGSLERFRIPADYRTPQAAGRRSDRIGPVFRDRDELAAASDIRAELDKALLASQFLLVICSPAAARSRWVNEEIELFLRHRGAERIVLLVVGGEPGASLQPGGSANEAFPPAILRLAQEPLWLDLRRRGVRKARALVQVAAALIDVGFDLLWQRERRRRRRLIAAAGIAVLLLAGVGGALFKYQSDRARAALERQQREAAQELAREQAQAERRKPQAQVAAFKQFLQASIKRDVAESKLDVPDDRIAFQILVGEDLNGDSMLDFIVLNTTPGFCGSGGCGMDAYIAAGDGKYRDAGSFFGYTNPRALTHRTDGFRDIGAVRYTVGSQQLWSIYRWQGKAYALAFHEFCGPVALEYCPAPDAVIDPVSDDERLDDTLRPGARYYAAPDLKAAAIEKPLTVDGVVGKVRGKDWYLVEIWKGTAAFVQATDVIKAAHKL